MTSAWWVPGIQVQRLEGGSFEVKGKRNYLPPAILVLGYAILWTSEDEETQERHVRRIYEPITEEVPVVDEAGEDLNENSERSVALTEQELEQDLDMRSESDDESIAHEHIKDDDKYNLQEYGSASDEENEPSTISIPSISNPRGSTQKRFLSAKQRRDLKKGKPVSATQSDSDSDVQDATSSIETVALSTKTKAQPKVRGKRGKMKKLKGKYEDQSEEERELARKLLGAKSTTTPSQPTPPTDETKPLPQKKPPAVPRPPKPIIDEPLEVHPLATQLRGRTWICH